MNVRYTQHAQPLRGAPTSLGVPSVEPVEIVQRWPDLHQGAIHHVCPGVRL